MYAPLFSRAWYFRSFAKCRLRKYSAGTKVCDHGMQCIRRRQTIYSRHQLLSICCFVSRPQCFQRRRLLTTARKIIGPSPCYTRVVCLPVRRHRGTAVEPHDGMSLASWYPHSAAFPVTAPRRRLLGTVMQNCKTEKLFIVDYRWYYGYLFFGNYRCCRTTIIADHR